MREYNTSLTYDRLQEVLDYSPETGEFRWKVTTARSVKVGALAGYLDNNGYRKIRIDKEHYLAHRLAWFYMTGEWPGKDIDHRNGDPTDNRICNLREVTNSQNCQNSARSWGRSKYRGVSWHKGGKKWNAQISVDGQRMHLGYFPTEELAAVAYQEARRKFHPFAR